MQNISTCDRKALDELHSTLKVRYSSLQHLKLNLNIARGVPSPEQVELSDDLLSLPGAADFMSADGVDVRNYMGQQGLREVRALFSESMEISPENLVVDGNSSLALMYDCVSHAWRAGVNGGTPWHRVRGGVAFLCPVPGYDRHFSICEAFGIRMIPVPMHADGPDVEFVRDAVAGDESIKGMWCVPKYSNPTGATYSESKIRALASMRTAADDFRLFWDNAYWLHHLTDEAVQIANVVALCEEYGNENRPLVFGSTSKITFAGAGLSMLGSSRENIRWWLRHASVRSVGPDKVNQLRHLRFLRNSDGLKALMQRHKELLAPRFGIVERNFRRLLEGTGVASWTQPKGGYFITLNVLHGTAKRVVELSKQAGVTLTPAGAPFPGGIDPTDSVLRIAPSSLAVDDVGQAAEVVAVSALLAAAELRLRQLAE
ncbi:aminotransferase class I/II-fold pyridoxal phosphate-dependent enzyme [Paraburkholderia sp. D15]|uniref:aminotransferase class I/II-fold pyridoxal phosphate-dependent enzyme n=1 Tax=Paraburkholderia sp. D15 TaxID=2880218 RepID=UPI00247A2F79|nr:aminotransferase class I/II-fold pyridoxal phosphate-dependent enzyme [Paraburkholderia sp. D15]WGS53267.1 aminotransferase class I/II-fold pyridoxal phosphate-dependent enzyme [Paraburkholderia sp. D15]